MTDSIWIVLSLTAAENADALLPVIRGFGRTAGAPRLNRRDDLGGRRKRLTVRTQGDWERLPVRTDDEGRRKRLTIRAYRDGRR